MSGGFMLFTCEKLLPHIDISRQAEAFEAYHASLKTMGWDSVKSKDPAENKLSFSRMDALGCNMTVDMELWADRSMNEANIGEMQRSDHRQIAFKAWFRGDACESYYSQTQALAANR